MTLWYHEICDTITLLGNHISVIKSQIAVNTNSLTSNQNVLL